MRQTLIILFYSLLLVQTLFRVIEFCFRAALPNENFYPNLSRAIEIPNQIAMTTSVGVELTLIFTMYKLCLAL